ncbi:DUF5675 family protein [Flagellimonas sp.]|uniref:DUF5675 family protein n=1 Tax=Flagellimonas sp. TaxID=2058762 RepID=UPI003BAFD0DE
MNWVLKIKRTSYNTNSVTGELFIKNMFICHTLELPWQQNRSYISSIPSGIYDAFLRYDKNDKWRLQLKNVPNRTGIQIHIGNYPSQIQGCVLVGEKVYNAKNSLANSAQAYNKIKRAFYGTDSPNSTPDVKIKVQIEYNHGRTKFISERGSIWEHQDGENWLDTYTPHKYTEYDRDLKHIYLLSIDKDMHQRFPLFGGVKEYKYFDGPWEKGGKFRREN